MSTQITRALAANVQTCEPPESITAHKWNDTPIVWADDPPDVAWRCCLRCSAQVLFDQERRDGFAFIPVVVYPASCFELAGRCACPRTANGTPKHLTGCAELDPVTVRDLEVGAPQSPPPPGFWHNCAEPCGAEGCRGVQPNQLRRPDVVMDMEKAVREVDRLRSEGFFPKEGKVRILLGRRS